ncbi:MAG: hypothetical protein ACXABF_13235 [Candidatus Thorarchaeota archaeon]|jgi:hypothetical protein
MNPILPYFLGFCGGAVISVIVLFLYERQNKQLKNLLEFTQRQLNSCLSKMMAVDYEKLAEADIAARSMGQAMWMQSQGFVTPEMDDMDMFNPEDYKVGDDAKQTS